MKLVLVFFSFFVIVFAYSQSTTDIRYEDPIAISLDCNTEDCLSFFDNIELYPNIKSIRISNYNGKKINKDIRLLSKLESITIENSPDLQLSDLFNNLKDIENLTEISLEDNSLEKLPKNIKLLSNLKSVNISNNDELELEKVIESLQEINGLEELYLPINSITDLPQNIGELKSLKVLDISNNNLEDIPTTVGDLNGLEEIYLEGNLITDATTTLSKVKNLKLKIIALDNELSEEEKKKLQELFPNTVIKEIDNNLINNEDTSDAEIDSEVLEINEKITSTPEDSVKNDITYGKLNVEGEKLFLYSQAYMHYPLLFQVNENARFDSIMFDERFLDSSYAYTTKIQADFFNSNRFVYGNSKLKFYKKAEKNEIWFTINRSRNPEFDAFVGMSWVYVGELSKKEFKKKYLRPIEHKWYRFRQWRYWTDFRLFYNGGAQNFDIMLKSTDGFEKITAYPRYNSLTRPVSDAQETYVKRFGKYSKKLNKRKIKYDKSLRSDKVRYERTVRKNEKYKWIAFQKSYMSRDERRLTKKEWLIYYDKVIANEKYAMGNASPSIENIERSMVLDGYSKRFELQNFRTNNNSQSYDSTRANSIRSLFQKEDGSMVAITKILVINNSAKSYQTYRGSQGIKVIPLLLKQNSNVTILAQLRNGDIGFVKKEEFKKIVFDKNLKYKFTLTTVSYSIGTVQMIRAELGI